MLAFVLGVQFVTMSGEIMTLKLFVDNLVIDRMVSALYEPVLNLWQNSILTQQGAQALDRAHFGQGSGQPIVLDNVRCDSSEMALFQCSHSGLFRHNCNHVEDAGVKCSEEEERLLHISVDVINVHTVSINWELQNITSRQPNSYKAECFGEAHHIEMSVNNTTFNLQLMGLLPSTSYNCCVSAVYESYVYTPKGACVEATTTIQPSESTYTEINSSTSSSADTTPESNSTASNSADTTPESTFRTSSSADTIIGGVLGFIIALLIILLAIAGAALVYLLRTKSVIPKE